jgi:hypothetical protein
MAGMIVRSMIHTCLVRFFGSMGAGGHTVVAVTTPVAVVGVTATGTGAVFLQSPVLSFHPSLFSF